MDYLSLFKEICSQHSPSFYSWWKVFSVVNFISWPFILQLYQVYLASSKVYIAMVLLDGFCYIRGCNLMLESLSIKYKETFQTIGHMCRICNNNKWPHMQNICKCDGRICENRPIRCTYATVSYSHMRPVFCRICEIILYA